MNEVRCLVLWALATATLCAGEPNSSFVPCVCNLTVPRAGVEQASDNGMVLDEAKLAHDLASFSKMSPVQMEGEKVKAKPAKKEPSPEQITAKLHKMYVDAQDRMKKAEEAEPAEAAKTLKENEVRQVLAFDALVLRIIRSEHTPKKSHRITS